MARTQLRSSGLFSGLVLISAGILLLLHYYGDLSLARFFSHWWPLLIIFWGVVKLYERATGGRAPGAGGGAITGSEILLVIGMLLLIAVVVTVERGKTFLEDFLDDRINIESGDTYSFDLEVAPQPISPGSRVLIRVGRGDVTVRESDDKQLHVSGKKTARTWSESEGTKMAQPVEVVIVKNGDAFEIQPKGYDLSDSHLRVDLEVSVPKKSPVSIKTDKGDVNVSDVSADLTVSDGNGDIDIHGTHGDVSVDLRKGDTKVSDTTGDVKISGKGGEIEVNNTSGSLTVEGDFFGPVRADQITKGVRLVSGKADLTLSALAGHLEAGTGNLDLVDAPGNLVLRTRDTEVNLENPGGKVNIDNRNANVNVRFSAAPKEDVQITNSSAEVAVTLPGNSSFEVQADCHNCDIDSEFPALAQTKSAAGDSNLSGKVGSAKGPKITIKTSYGNIAIRRSSMDMPMRPQLPKLPNLPTPAMPHAPLPPPAEQ
jgi:DUF4097 and DUF4098 domain-containing protein YvlB